MLSCFINSNQSHKLLALLANSMILTAIAGCPPKVTVPTFGFIELATARETKELLLAQKEGEEEPGKTVPPNMNNS